MTTLADGTVLASRLIDAQPRSRLAVRFAERHDEDPGRPGLLQCAVCGDLGRPARCEPLLVGGEVIGSVLVQHDLDLDSEAHRRIHDTVSQASPVLGNLRTLALAEFRANNDALTGVANKRAANDTLKRLAAISSRTVSPLAAVLLDLDNLKRLNDIYGHEKGDETLAAVGAAIRGALRDSDFVGPVHGVDHR